MSELEVFHIQRFIDNNKMGLKYKISGSHITDAVYDDIRRIKGTDLFVKIRYADQWGVVTCTGKSALAVKDDICCFENGLFTVLLNGEYKYERPDVIVPDPPERKPYPDPIWIRLRNGNK